MKIRFPVSGKLADRHQALSEVFHEPNARAGIPNVGRSVFLTKSSEEQESIYKEEGVLERQ